MCAREPRAARPNEGRSRLRLVLARNLVCKLSAHALNQGFVDVGRRTSVGHGLNMKRLLAGMVLALWLSPGATARLSTLNDWMEGTGAGASPAVRDQFRLYAFGVVMGTDIMTTELGKDRPAWAQGVCIPDGTSSSTAMDRLRAEALRNPNLGDSNSAMGLRQLASKAFPCK